MILHVSKNRMVRVLSLILNSSFIQQSSFYPYVFFFSQVEVTLTQIIDTIESIDVAKLPVLQAMLAFMRKMVKLYFQVGITDLVFQSFVAS